MITSTYEFIFAGIFTIGFGLFGLYMWILPYKNSKSIDKHLKEVEEDYKRRQAYNKANGLPPAFPPPDIIKSV
jgi:hypothetical protein